MGLTRSTWFAIVVVVAVTAGGATALANHVFPDSTDNQAFHEQVGLVAGAGCTTGFPDGTFHPLDAVNRQQFAAGINRCGGRVARGSNAGQATEDDDDYIDPDVLTITAGAVDSEVAVGGFVLIQGTVIARTASGATCPCFVQASAWDDSAPLGQEQGVQSFSTIPQGNTALNEAFTTIPIFDVFPIDPGETADFGFRAIYEDGDTPTVTFEPRLTAIYVPFGPDGDNTIDFET
jgi:S-layer homology domain